MWAEFRSLLAFSVVAFLVFVFFPTLDLPISHFMMTYRLFDFPWLWRFIFYVVYWGSFLFVLTLLATVIFPHYVSDKLGVRYQSALFFLLCWIVGPLLIVNVILKDHVGRPRPYSVIELKNTQVASEEGHARAVMHYVAPFVLSNACHKNCSFVSGHASAGFVFIALGYVYTLYRRRIFWLSCLAGGIIGLARVVQGAHFFSDVIFSFVFTYAGILMCVFFVKHWLGYQIDMTPAYVDRK